MKKGSLEIVVLFFVFDFKILKDCHTNFTPDLGFEDPIRKYLNFYENFNDINQRIERLRTESSLNENPELQTILDTYMVEHRTKDFLNYAKSL